jgi:uncharacterized cofD-like protein
MTHLTGDFGRAVQFSSEVLAVNGRIYPSTAANVVLEATLARGDRVIGETRISRSRQPIARVQLSPRKVKPLAQTLEAIAQADLITLGPGSLFTSIVPNLLVEGIPRAIASSPAVKAYFSNLMTQPGETTDLRASDHLSALLRHAGRHARGLIDVCVVNSGALATRAVKDYRAREARPVENDIEGIQRLGVRVLCADLVRLSGRNPQKIRHDSGAAGAVAIDLARAARRQRKLAS